MINYICRCNIDKRDAIDQSDLSVTYFAVKSFEVRQRYNIVIFNPCFFSVLKYNRRS